MESRHLLQDRLGHEIVHLAYPYGSVTSAVRALAAEAGYLSACASEKRLAAAGDDLLWFPRVPVYGGESLIDFMCRPRTAAPDSVPSASPAPGIQLVPDFGEGVWLLRKAQQ